MEAAPAPTRPRFALALMLLALVPVVLWPGDVSWLIDEPRILAAAWHANHDGQLADGGLYGNFGIRYGPLPTQLYQALLLVTHDPRVLVVLRGLLCAGVTGGALLWLARSLALPAWFAAALVISPHLVNYHRVLWDANFCLPLGTLAFAALADFLRTARPWSLRICMGASAVLPLIHPMALALAGPVLGWLAWRERAALWRDRRALAVVGAGLLALHAQYLWHVPGQLVARLSGSVEKGYPGGESRAASALAPLLGGRLLSGADYLEKLARPAPLPALQMAAQWSAQLIYPLIWLGLALGLWRGWRAWRTGEKFSVRENMTAVALAGLFVQAGLSGLMRIPALPQYFFGSYVLHAFMAWLAVEALSRWRVGALPGVLYGAGAAVLTISAAFVLHAHGFEKPRWPTLGNSIAVACELNHFTDTTVETYVFVLQKNPQILRTLRLLFPPAPGAAQRESGRLAILGSTFDLGRIRLEWRQIVDGQPYERAPSHQPLDVTPLPKNWVPAPGTW